MTLAPLNILFLSTGNAARSVMAEAILNAKGSERFRARSAGVRPLPGVDAEAVCLLSAHGYETLSLHTKDWTFFRDAPTGFRPEVVVTLSEEAKEVAAAWPYPVMVIHWALDNPLAANRADVREWKFRKCFSVLEARVSALMKAKPALAADELFLQLKSLSMVV